MDPSWVLVVARRAAGLSQRDLADLAGTSGPAVAAMETGRRDPRASTWLRLLNASGVELVAVPARSRNDRYVDAMCARYAELVAARPALLADARDALDRLSQSDYNDSWSALLTAGPEAVIAVLTSPSPAARGLKSDSPFALLGLITEPQRREILEGAR